jgi:hypothetical protein
MVGTALNPTAGERGVLALTMYPDYLMKAAEKLLPHLVRHARVRKTIPRDELGTLVGMNPELHLPRALDAVREAFAAPRGLPDLTCLVAGIDGSPSASPQDLDEVFACQEWDFLLKELGIDPLETQPKDMEEEGYAYTNFLYRHPSAENEIRSLVEFIAENPQVLGLRTWRSGVIDHAFLTGDLCDILFDRDGLPVIAVAATLHRGSQVRGIYRLVKLRALLEAEKGHGESLAVQCYLAAPEFPADIRSYASRFKVTCVEVRSQDQ